MPESGSQRVSNQDNLRNTLKYREMKMKYDNRKPGKKTSPLRPYAQRRRKSIIVRLNKVRFPSSLKPVF